MTDPSDKTTAFQPSIPPLEPECDRSMRLCPVCGNKMWQKHAETCAGPRQRVWWPEPIVAECACPPGFHLGACELVSGGAV